MCNREFVSLALSIFKIFLSLPIGRLSLRTRTWILECLPWDVLIRFVSFDKQKVIYLHIIEHAYSLNPSNLESMSKFYRLCVREGAVWVCDYCLEERCIDYLPDQLVVHYWMMKWNEWVICINSAVSTFFLSFVRLCSKSLKEYFEFPSCMVKQHCWLQLILPLIIIIDFMTNCVIYLFLLINRFLTCCGALSVMTSGLSGNDLNSFNKLRGRCWHPNLS